jgi:hypothetical protein
MDIRKVVALVFALAVLFAGGFFVAATSSNAAVTGYEVDIIRCESTNTYLTYGVNQLPAASQQEVNSIIYQQTHPSGGISQVRLVSLDGSNTTFLISHSDQGPGC